MLERYYIAPSVIRLYEQGLRRWYSGTTVENFLTCASVIAGGNVQYNKRKAPHDYPDRIFVIANPAQAFGLSITLAKQLGQRPLVISCTPSLNEVLLDIGSETDNGIAELRNPVKINQVLYLRENLSLDCLDPYSNPPPFVIASPIMALATLK